VVLYHKTVLCTEDRHLYSKWIRTPPITEHTKTTLLTTRDI